MIDIGAHRVIAEIPISGALRAVAALPGDSRVYVGAVDRVVAIDSRAQAAIAQVSMSLPISLALSPSRPAVYVGIDIGGLHPVPGPGLFQINTDTQTLAGGFQPDRFPARLALSGDGALLYAMGFSLDVFDVATRSLLRTLPLPPNATTFALNPRGDRLYVSQFGNAGDTVLEMDAKTGATLGSVRVGRDAQHMVVDGNGNRLFVSNHLDNTVSVVDIPTHAVVATIPVGIGPRGIDITAENNVVLVVNSGSNSVSVIDAVALRAIDNIPVAGQPNAVGRFIGGKSGPIFPDVLSGLWYNPAEPGWGVQVSHRGNRIFAAWFTYNASGAAKWYVSSDCVMNSQLPTPPATGEATCTGNLYETTGPRFFSDPFNPSVVSRAKLGIFQMGFRDKDNGAMSIVLPDTVKTMTLKRQVFRAEGPSPAVDYTDLWWNPTESGWGIGITQQFGTMFLAWFAYDDSGAPAWYVASNCVVNAGATGCSGELYRMSGPPDPLRNPFDVSRVRPTTVGTITASFSDANRGTLDYTVDGKAGRKTITRQLF